MNGEAVNMKEWKFTIRETSVFIVELETEDEDEAWTTIREMLGSGEIRIDRPDGYENDEFIEEA